MQLFVCDFFESSNQLTVEDSNVLFQLKRVLRVKIWDICFIQNAWKCTKRYEIKIKYLDKNKLIWDILNTYKNPNNDYVFWMIICMPNRRDKIEMIVQKLSEIWINNILFWPSQRSVIKTMKGTKIERLLKISKEAVEQSWSWIMPRIDFVDNIKNIVNDCNFFVFDIKLDMEWKYKSDKKSNEKINSKIFYWLVWPEWWLTEKDYANFWSTFEVFCIWENVLRTETSAIIWAWLIKNKKMFSKSWK